MGSNEDSMDVDPGPSDAVQTFSVTSKQYCDILVILFCGTVGTNEPRLLGSDESDVIIIAWQLVDISLNTTGDIHYIYVKPNTTEINSETFNFNNVSQDTEPTNGKSSPDSEIGNTGISKKQLDEAPNFSEAIKQFEQTLRYELNKKNRPCSFCLCTDGQLHIRQVLMPSSVRNDTNLPDFFYSFFDLKEEFYKHIKNQNNKETCDLNNLQDSTTIEVEFMLKDLKVEIDELGTFGVDQVRKMSSVVQVLLSEKHSHVFVEPERIDTDLETKPSNESAPISDELVVRTRGLPWQASDHDVARFFKGLNITKGGVALVLNNLGRRNGEALVRFTNPLQRRLALLRHKHHMGNRYIEVYRATTEDFLKIAAGTSGVASEFLNKTNSDGIVRIRGLPFTATPNDIIGFFATSNIEVSHGASGVLLVKFFDGKFTGDAFVLFKDDATAQKALTKHKQTIGARYVEIFKSTAAEVQQVITRYSTNENISSQQPILTMTSSAKPQQLFHFVNYPTNALQSGSIPIGSVPGLIPAANQIITNPGAIRNYIRMRGMPYTATVVDIRNFLGHLASEMDHSSVKFVVNSQGRPSGDAFVRMNSVEGAARACCDVSKGGCHKKHMGTRYVEVFQCSHDEMQCVMMGGTLNRNGTIPPPGSVAPERFQQLSPVSPLSAIPQQFAPAAMQPLSPTSHPQQIHLIQASPQQYYISPPGGVVLLQQPPSLMSPRFLAANPFQPQIVPQMGQLGAFVSPQQQANGVQIQQPASNQTTPTSTGNSQQNVNEMVKLGNEFSGVIY